MPEATPFNLARDVVDRLAERDPDREALRALGEAGTRSYSFGAVARESRRTAAALHRLGLGRGDVVMTMAGATPEWVFALLGAWRLGAIALPCSEQLRRGDLVIRIEQARPRLVLFAEPNRAELEAALVLVQDAPRAIGIESSELRSDREAPPPPQTTVLDPALVIFTSGTAGEPRGVVHNQGYLRGQSVQAEHWLGATPSDLVWCTAASGWSKSARNAFVAPWSRGAACLLHDGRFDPAERLELIAREGVSVLCQTPTEYRMIAKRASIEGIGGGRLRRLVSAGEPLNPEIIDVFRNAVGLDIHDGYGQTETGQLTGMPAGEPVRAGSMGRPLPGFGLEIREQDGNPVEEGELCLDPATVPTFFRGYLGEPPFMEDLWRTGDRVRQDEEGFLWFAGRIDDVILSAGYRIGPFEVESALVSHPAVAEAAAIAAPDAERGAVVRAVIVLRDGRNGDEKLAKELQEHVKRTTAPYKYPRIVEFRDRLPKTASGKIKRAELRREQVGYGAPPRG
jgi:acyl-coenzyme A synthetase/AMP-(fatty) acid ligase